MIEHDIKPYITCTVADLIESFLLRCGASGEEYITGYPEDGPAGEILPIVADALMDAGCDDDVMIRCLQTRTHWTVESIRYDYAYWRSAKREEQREKTY